MKSKLVLVCLVCSAVTSAPGVSLAAPLGTQFTYQGRVRFGDQSLTDSCNFKFSLWDAVGSGCPPTGGTQIGSTLLFDGGVGHSPTVNVRVGLFTVELDFGAGAFNGNARWLEMAIQCPGDVAYTTLCPRQSLPAAPNASFSAAPWQTSGGYLFYNGGNVGIGTQNPVSKVTVARPANSGNVELRIGANDQTSRDFIVRKNTSTPYDSYLLGSANTTPGTGATMRFFTADTASEERLTILYGGNVGIGTPSPGEKLEVNGKLRVGSTQVWDNEINRYGPNSNLYIQMRDASDNTTTDVGNTIINPNSGNVGIGTPSPVNRLDVEGGMVVGASYSGSNTAPSNGLLVQGNVGIGTPSPLWKLHVLDTSSAIQPIAQFQNTTSANHFIEVSNSAAIVTMGVDGATGATHGDGYAYSSSDNFFIGISSTPTLYVNGMNNGKVGIGTTAPGYQLELSLNSAAKPTSNTWTISSDRRLKKNVQPLTGSLEKLLSLRGVSYEWIDPSTQGNMTGTYPGMIAQDVEKVFPEWIGTGADGYKTLTVIGFEGLAVEGLRELRQEKDAQVAELQARVSALERALSANARPSNSVSLASIGALAIPALALLGFVGLVVRRRSQNGGGR